MFYDSKPDRARLKLIFPFSHDLKVEVHYVRTVSGCRTTNLKQAESWTDCWPRILDKTGWPDVTLQVLNLLVLEYDPILNRPTADTLAIAPLWVLSRASSGEEEFRFQSSFSARKILSR
ncbi:hypothetical protein NE237_012227 [Protea cynaroides]|uniref:Uncharacterized protein n=1 Tax=Protea cynaroides TaxID=273540 RepID=A0A9Q0JWM0_9MAGN|nr:hypothetical protein NE237_012227 [Protea cynaroides]